MEKIVKLLYLILPKKIINYIGKSKTLKKIRNKILEIIKDTKVSREEFILLLKEITTDSSRWLRRNSQYFNISEDGVAPSKIGNNVLKNIAISHNIIKTSSIMTYEEFSQYRTQK